jgi:hypothetical protein
VSGADPKKRVEAIMINRPATKPNLARKFLLAASATIAVASPVLAGLIEVASCCGANAERRRAAAAG